MAKAHKQSGFEQVAALPWRRVERGIHVLLVTTRETGRWIVPRGWPIKGLSAAGAAETEAFEEAGVSGRIGKKPVGSYTYEKRFPKRTAEVTVSVYPLEVTKERTDWPEKGQRETHWVSAQAAALAVSDQGLAEIIRAFAARFEPPESPATDQASPSKSAVER
ncbi:NUDIX hydrolase [Chthonobacter albigriseus]|uniref:NUDIX hydrolase n=1 Tax=Chthonobacter albigriseus TaxID=1683161 RepID=UPI0031402E15